MSYSPLIAAVQQRLRHAGYRDLATPFRMAGVEFAFTAAMRGRDGRALDLILIFDTTTGAFGDRDASRIRARVEALSRALDITESRFVITAVLVGAALVDSVEALAETCRVLQVDGVALDANGIPADEASSQQLEDQIRVLLPLTLPAHLADPAGGGAPAIEQLVAVLSPDIDKRLVQEVVAASQAGGEAVSAAAGEVLAASFAYFREEPRT